MSKWKWYRDGTEMVQRWYRDGTEMVQKWHRDGTEIVQRRYRDGTEMVQTQVKLKGLEPGQFQAGWNSIITVLIITLWKLRFVIEFDSRRKRIPSDNFCVAEEQ